MISQTKFSKYTIFPFPVIFIFKISQIIVSISMISQFHEFFFQIKFLAGFCHLAQLWVALGLPPSPRARATTPRRQRSPCLSSVLWPLSVLWLIQALLPTGWQKDCYFSNLWKSGIFSKSPMYFDVILTDFLTLRSSASSHRPHSLNTMNNSTQPVVCESSCLT